MITTIPASAYNSSCSVSTANSDCCVAPAAALATSKTDPVVNNMIKNISGSGQPQVSQATQSAQTQQNTTYWKDSTTGATGSITDNPGDHKLLDSLLDREMRSGHSFETNDQHAYPTNDAHANSVGTGTATTGSAATADATAVAANVSPVVAAQAAKVQAAALAKQQAAATDPTAVTDPTVATDAAAVRLANYASDTGKHIKPDGTLDLPRIKGDYSAPPEVRKAASDLLDSGATVSTRDQPPVTSAPSLSSAAGVAGASLAAAGTYAALATAAPTVSNDKSLLGAEPNMSGAPKAAMADNLNVLADHLSGNSDLSKEDYQKIAKGDFGPLDHDIPLNAADVDKIKAGAKHVTENFDKFDTAYSGKDANAHVSPYDLRAYSDVQKTSAGIDASNTLLGKDTNISNDEKPVVKDNLSVLANHLSGNSNLSKEDFQKIANGDLSSLDHDIALNDGDSAKIQAGAKYITENFDKFDTAGTGRSGGNGGVSPYDIRGYTDTSR